MRPRFEGATLKYPEGQDGPVFAILTVAIWNNGAPEIITLPWCALRF
jgi:hypothetical protein